MKGHAEIISLKNFHYDFCLRTKIHYMSITLTSGKYFYYVFINIKICHNFLNVII